MGVGVKFLRTCQSEIRKAQGAQKSNCTLRTNPYRAFMKKNRTKFIEANNCPRIAKVRMYFVYSKFPEVRTNFEKRAEKDAKILEEMQRKSKDHRLNGYALFLREEVKSAYAATTAGRSHANRLRDSWRIVSEKWKGLSSKEKLKYAKRARILHVRSKRYLESLRSYANKQQKRTSQ